MYGRGIVCSFYNSVTFKEVAFSHERENKTFSWVVAFCHHLVSPIPVQWYPQQLCAFQKLFILNIYFLIHQHKSCVRKFYV